MLEQRNLQMCYHVNKPNIDAKGKKCDHVKKKKKKAQCVCMGMCTNICLPMHTHGKTQSGSPGHWRGGPR